jgi:crossover junction endodeoxyribonuclease RuvC
VGQLRDPRCGDGEADLIILGLDPSLSCTGWGIVAKSGNRLSHIANGQVRTDAKASLPERLVTLDRELSDVIARYQPTDGAVEEVFVNKNPQSTLKLGQARGVCLLALARAGLPVSEYATRLVKKAIVGTGGAEKAQVQAMLGVLLPGVKLAGADAADALAVAIAHAHLANAGTF